MSVETLRDLLRHKLTDKLVCEKFDELKAIAQVKWKPDFSAAWLKKIVEEIDRLWYDGQLLPTLNNVYKRVDIGLGQKNRDDRIAGYVQAFDNDRSISLHMNRKLFSELEFSDEKFGYHTGGLLCKDKLVCFLHVLLHETVHLILCLCEKTQVCLETRDHGKFFTRAIWNLFRQTDSQHGLLPGYQQTSDLARLQKEVQPGVEVELFAHGKWIPVQVVKRGHKWVYLKNQNKEAFKAHIGLIRLSTHAD